MKKSDYFEAKTQIIKSLENAQGLHDDECKRIRNALTTVKTDFDREWQNNQLNHNLAMIALYHECIGHIARIDDEIFSDVIECFINSDFELDTEDTEV